jgi:hypothetical protein
MAIAALSEFPPQPGLSEPESREQYDDVSRGQLMRSCAEPAAAHRRGGHVGARGAGARRPEPRDRLAPTLRERRSR